MQLIKARFVFLCDEDFTILKDKVVAFDEDIKEIGKEEDLVKKYPAAKLLKTDLLMPAFINTHTHLEFCASLNTLDFGDFLAWLASIMSKRDDLSQKAKDGLIAANIKAMQKSGVSTIGEISSFGSDLKACANSTARIVFFNELLGRNWSEENEAAFKDRLNESLKYKSKLFTPALSVHSPYSTHPKFANFILELAKKNQLLISTHFLESDYEDEYLRQDKGQMKENFSKFSQAKTFYTPASFIELFKGCHTLFTHCVYAENEFKLLKQKNFSLTHCPRSNALLSKKTFPLKDALRSGLRLHLATDGLSSNYSLSMLDELRTALFIHAGEDLASLAKTLLLMATKYAGEALAMDIGEIKLGFKADLACFCFKPELPSSQLALHFVLNTKEASKLFVNGEEIRL